MRKEFILYFITVFIILLNSHAFTQYRMNISQDDRLQEKSFQTFKQDCQYWCLECLDSSFGKSFQNQYSTLGKLNQFIPAKKMDYIKKRLWKLLDSRRINIAEILRLNSAYKFLCFDDFLILKFDVIMNDDYYAPKIYAGYKIQEDSVLLLKTYKGEFLLENFNKMITEYYKNEKPNLYCISAIALAMRYNSFIVIPHSLEELKLAFIMCSDSWHMRSEYCFNVRNILYISGLADNSSNIAYLYTRYHQIQSMEHYNCRNTPSTQQKDSFSNNLNVSGKIDTLYLDSRLNQSFDKIESRLLTNNISEIKPKISSGIECDTVSIPVLCCYQHALNFFEIIFWKNGTIKEIICKRLLMVNIP